MCDRGERAFTSARPSINARITARWPRRAAHLAGLTPRGDHPDVPIIIRQDAGYFDENIFEMSEDPGIGHLGGAGIRPAPGSWAVVIRFRSLTLSSGSAGWCMSASQATSL